MRRSWPARPGRRAEVSLKDSFPWRLRNQPALKLANSVRFWGPEFQRASFGDGRLQTMHILENPCKAARAVIAKRSLRLRREGAEVVRLAHAAANDGNAGKD